MLVDPLAVWNVALIVAEPILIPVTRPVAFTEAVDDAELDQPPVGLPLALIATSIAFDGVEPGVKLSVVCKPLCVLDTVSPEQPMWPLVDRFVAPARFENGDVAVKPVCPEVSQHITIASFAFVVVMLLGVAELVPLDVYVPGVPSTGLDVAALLIGTTEIAVVPLALDVHSTLVIAAVLAMYHMANDWTLLSGEPVNCVHVCEPLSEIVRVAPVFELRHAATKNCPAVGDTVTVTDVALPASFTQPVPKEMGVFVLMTRFVTLAVPVGEVKAAVAAICCVAP
jgi:hypothetical protein